MEKKNKYITIATTETIYNQLKEKADKDRRPLAQFVALLVVDSMEWKK